MSSIPIEISTPWNDLLKNRVLLHQAKHAVGEIKRFEDLLQSPQLADQNQVAALESYANRTFNLVIDMTKALLISKAPDDSSTIKGDGRQRSPRSRLETAHLLRGSIGNS